MDYDLTKITINYVVGSVLMFGLMKMPIPSNTALQTYSII